MAVSPVRDVRSKDALERLIDAPDLAVVVPRLRVEVLHQLIRTRGLEACGGILAVATPAQVTALVDLDLWQPVSAGGDDEFDAERFGEWLEALADHDPAAAAGVVASMPRDVAIAGLSRFIRVFDPATFEPTTSDIDPLEYDASPTEGAHDLGGYLLRPRTVTAWDAVVTMLTALADDCPEAFEALMRGCRALSNSLPEVDGLDDLLSTSDQWIHDTASTREHRRSGQGYLSSTDARALLQSARQARQRGPSPIHTIAAASFRAADEGSAIGSSRRLLTGDAGPALPDDEFHRTRQLAFLANALVSGCSLMGKPFTAGEAWDAAAGVCALGREIRGESDDENDSDLLDAFVDGWRTLHEEVGLFVSAGLIALLERLTALDNEMSRDLDALRLDLSRERAAGTPWRAAETMDTLAALDMPAWAALCGVLSECPVVPDVLTAIVERRTGGIDASAFEYFSTRAQIERVHAFVERLPELLGGR